MYNQLGVKLFNITLFRHLKNTLFQGAVLACLARNLPIKDCVQIIKENT